MGRCWRGGLGVQHFQGGLAVGVPDRVHQATEFVPVAAGEGADCLGDVPAVQPPGPVRGIILLQPPQPFPPVAEGDVNARGKAPVSQQLELPTEQGRGLGGDHQVFVLETHACGAASRDSGAADRYNAVPNGHESDGPDRGGRAAEL